MPSRASNRGSRILILVSFVSRQTGWRCVLEDKLSDNENDVVRVTHKAHNGDRAKNLEAIANRLGELSQAITGAIAEHELQGLAEQLRIIAGEWPDPEDVTLHRPEWLVVAMLAHRCARLDREDTAGGLLKNGAMHVLLSDDALLALSRQIDAGFEDFRVAYKALTHTDW